MTCIPLGKEGTLIEALARLKWLTDEREGTVDQPIPRMFSDEELERLLEMHSGQVEKCAYDVLIRKAENTSLTLPDGTTLPDQSAHYLRRAAMLRRVHTRNACRADDPPPRMRKED